MLKQKIAVSFALAAITAVSLTFPALANAPKPQADTPRSAVSNKITNDAEGKMKKSFSNELMEDDAQGYLTVDGITLTIVQDTTSQKNNPTGRKNLLPQLQTDENGMKYFTTEEGAIISFTAK